MRGLFGGVGETTDDDNRRTATEKIDGRRRKAARRDIYEILGLRLFCGIRSVFYFTILILIYLRKICYPLGTFGKRN